MRQEAALVVTITVAGVLVVVLLVFGVVRSPGRQEHMTGVKGNEHVMPHEAEEPHEHVESHEAMAQHDGALKLSGKLEEGVRVIKMAALDFKFEPSTIVVRQGEKVRLEVTSEDVTHGIGIEGYEIDRKLEPGKTEVIAFTAVKSGRHHFYCSVYCGTGHGDMQGVLIVLSR